jgi:transposase
VSLELRDIWHTAQLAISDNDRQFDNAEFRSFTNRYEFNVSYCCPYHKEGNGKAETTVKIAKQIIKKCNKEKEDVENWNESNAKTIFSTHQMHSAMRNATTWYRSERQHHSKD